MLHPFSLIIALGSPMGPMIPSSLGSSSSTRHEFCPIEQVLNPIRKWLAIPYNNHATTAG